MVDSDAYNDESVSPDHGGLPHPQVCSQDSIAVLPWLTRILLSSSMFRRRGLSLKREHWSVEVLAFGAVICPRYYVFAVGDIPRTHGRDIHRDGSHISHVSHD